MEHIENPSIRPTLRSLVLVLTASVVLLAPAVNVSAASLTFSEDFDTDHTANWTINKGPGANLADVFFDYSTVGIPSAPHSVGSATRGLKLVANCNAADQPASLAAGLSASPTGQSFLGDYELRFDMWCNFNGPAPGSGNGSTQETGGGIGTSGTTANYVGTANGFWCVGTGDGNSATDYRVYTPGNQASIQDGSPVYLAGGSRNSSAALYTTTFPARACPAAQVALYPQQTGSAAAGSLGWTWHDVSVKKVGTLVTWSIDGTALAIFDMSTNGTAGGKNILFVQSDVNNTASTDANRTNLLFGLIDNIRVTNLAAVVTASATTSVAYEQGTVEGVVTLTRAFTDSSQPLTVTYAMSGTAINGTDYTNLPATVTFASGDLTTNIFVKPIDDTIPELTETAILTLAAGSGYTVEAPGSATVLIVDNETPTLSITNRDAQMYERTNDYIRFTITRRGDTNADLTAGSAQAVNITYGGTATAGTDYYGPATVDVPAGAVTQDFKVFPICNGNVTGPLTITATVSPGTGYDVGTPATSGTPMIVDADDPPETVLWSDNLQADTSANWTQLFAATNSDTYDATVEWAYDYSAQGIPPAPHSGADTHGLRMTVNKNDATPASAALNFYPISSGFSGNYALRFDMYLIKNSTLGQTEYALFGIHHDGLHTNWFRFSTTSFNGVNPAGWNFDGVFYDVEADGAGSGDYVAWSSPTTGNHNPTPLLPPPISGRNASTLTGVFKFPPWTASLVGGGAAANVSGSTTPIWADVELKQVNGVIYWSINHTLIFAYTNTTGYTSGNIMLGYADAFDSIGSSGGSVIYANARVITLESPVITNIVDNAGSLEITFVGNAADVPSQFVLQQSAPLATGTYADTSSAITPLGGGSFKAVKAAGTSPTFYRIRRIY